MKSLLQLMLIAYYTDCKRRIPARLTRALDADIRVMVGDNPDLQAIVSQCKKVAEAKKARRRREDAGAKIPHMHHGSSHVQHVPCRDRGTGRQQKAS